MADTPTPPARTAPGFWLTAPPVEDLVSGTYVLKAKASPGRLTLRIKRGEELLSPLTFADTETADRSLKLRAYYSFLTGEETSPPALKREVIDDKHKPPITIKTAVLLLVLAELACTLELSDRAISDEQLAQSGLFPNTLTLSTLYSYLSGYFCNRKLRGNSLVTAKDGTRGRRSWDSPMIENQRRAFMKNVGGIEYDPPVGTVSDPGSEPLVGLERLAFWLKTNFDITLNLPSENEESVLDVPAPPKSILLQIDLPAPAGFDPAEVERFITDIPTMFFGRPCAAPKWVTLRRYQEHPMRDMLPYYVRHASAEATIVCLRAILPLAFYFGRYSFWGQVAETALLSHRDDEEIAVHASFILGCCQFHLGELEQAKKAMTLAQKIAASRGWHHLELLSAIVVAECIEDTHRSQQALRIRLSIQERIDARQSSSATKPIEKETEVSLGRYNARSLGILFGKLGNDAQSEKWFIIESRYGSDWGKWRADASVSVSDLELVRGNVQEALGSILKAKPLLRRWRDRRWLSAAMFREAMAYELLGEYQMAQRTWAAVRDYAAWIPIKTIAAFADHKVRALEAHLLGHSSSDVVVLSPRSPRAVIHRQTSTGGLM